ncbi:hypothetical protein [Aquihabitans sp. McL0605]|uniref:hypothetical protein n=1 Tax=Aquihabitans sp. McL0605 TaxID=3415671 RepID=UPI003CEF238D
MSDFDDEPNVASDASDGRTDQPSTAPRSKGPATSDADDDWDDDWDDDERDERGGRRDLTLVYAIVAAAIVIVLAVVLTRPKDDNNSSTNASGGTTTEATAPQKNWQGPVGDAVGANGADAQKRAQAASGVYIWTDFGGWHLRSNNTQEVKVTVAADQVKVKKTDDYNDKDEGGGSFSTEEVVTLPAGNGSEGIGLDLGTSEKATFTVTIDGKNVPITEIMLGGAKGQADSNPVTFVKA